MHRHGADLSQLGEQMSRRFVNMLWMRDEVQPEHVSMRLAACRQSSASAMMQWPLWHQARVGASTASFS